MYSTSLHKTSHVYKKAWIAALNAARTEAFRTGTGAKRNFESVCDVSLPDLPTIEKHGCPKMSLFAISFVVIKVSKRLQSIAEIRSTGMNRSHASFWIREFRVLLEEYSHPEASSGELDDDLIQAERSVILSSSELTKVPTSQQLKCAEMCD